MLPGRLTKHRYRKYRMGDPKGRMVALQTYLQSLTMRGLWEREKVLNKGIPKHSNLQFMSPWPRERGTTGKEGHRDT
jgi:hypothetical protein